MRSLIVCTLVSLMGAREAEYVEKMDKALQTPNYFKPSIKPLGDASPRSVPTEAEPSVPRRANPINPVSEQEGVVFRKLSVVMTPIIAYFNNNNSEFQDWWKEAELIMDEKDKDRIKSNLYDDLVKRSAEKLPDDNRSENDRKLDLFWEGILGELLVRSLPKIGEEAGKLEEEFNAERSKGVEVYEFKEIENKKASNEAEFSGTTKFILDNLGIGITNRNTGMYTDVIEPFLNAAVAFKTLSKRMFDNL